jgi:hypothetical protein
MISLTEIALSVVPKVIKTDPSNLHFHDITSGQLMEPLVGRGRKEGVLIIFKNIGLIEREDYEKSEDLSEILGVRDVWFVCKLIAGAGGAKFMHYLPDSHFRVLSGVLFYDEKSASESVLLTRCIRVDSPGGRLSAEQEIQFKILSSSSLSEVGTLACDGIFLRAGTELAIPRADELAFVHKVASSLPDEGRHMRFLGDLAQFVEDQESYADYENPEVSYSTLHGFRLCKGGDMSKSDLLLDFMSEADSAAEKVDKRYVISWLRHVNRTFRSDAPLTRRSASMMPVFLPRMHTQATLGAMSDHVVSLKHATKKLLEQVDSVDLFSLAEIDQVPLAHYLKGRLKSLGSYDGEEMPVPFRRLFRQLESPLHDAFSCACELIDFVVQFHSMVAASLARQFSPWDSPLTRFFDEKSYTDLNAWLSEFHSARAEFDKQFTLIKKGRSPMLSQLVDPWALPCLAGFFSPSIFELLKSLKQIRNRNFAHSGNYSPIEKSAVVSEVRGLCQEYVDKTGPAWSVLSVGTISDLDGGYCQIKPIGVASGEVSDERYKLAALGSPQVGDLVLALRGSARSVVMPVMPAYYLLPAGVPDSDHLYFISSQESEAKDGGVVYKFNCYTGAPRGELTFTKDAPEIVGLLRNIQSMKDSEHSVPLVISWDANFGAYSFCLLSGSSIHLLSEAEVAGVLSSYINERPLVLSKERMLTIPDPEDETNISVPPEMLFAPGSSFVLDILVPRYEVGKNASVGLPMARFTQITVLARFE